MHTLLFTSLTLELRAAFANADGNGLIGWGKTMYNPACAFACRTVIKSNPLLCTPEDGTVNYGTVHSPIYTAPECFTRDPAFLRTMAVCIDTYCSVSDHPSTGLIEEYWASHLATTTVGSYKWKPAVSYADALTAGREDERVAAANETVPEHHEKIGDLRRRHSHGASAPQEETFFTFNVSSPLPLAKKKAPMNVTSFVDPVSWQKAYNGMRDFETNEKGHSTYSITVMLVALLLPIPLSLLRFVPGLPTSTGWSYLQATLIYPATWGRHHREPVGAAIGGGMVPTRGQALYIAFISMLNVIFLLTPYVHTHPQTTFASLKEQDISIIGNRAGVMAMGNAVAMFVFAGRNNPFLWVTDWSYSTYLLLHRWLGYWTILHTVLHSVMLLAYYKLQGSYEDELARTYWVWGIVATVAVVVMFPASLLVVRQKVYEVFLVLHVVLTVVFVVGYYYHIWYCYQYNWGYEIFAYIVGGIWGAERVVRLVRMALKGSRTATVSEVPGSNGEVLKIHIEGVRPSGVAYLCFPTLGWRFWETHPFSVATSESKRSAAMDEEMQASASAVNGSEKAVATTERSLRDGSNHTRDSSAWPRNGATFIVRVRTGITAKLAARLSASDSHRIQLRVLVEGSYHSNAAAQLAQCTHLLCIAGGVGITAVLPYLHEISAPRHAKLFWGVRQRGILDTLGSELDALPSAVQVRTVVGERMDIREILQQETAVTGAKRDGGKELLGIVVCGPAGMADEVRQTVSKLGRGAETMRPFVLVDEAFTW
ncbi:uncharacterized protein CC84DRAFT_1217309 [Paraphaeosphaeria sporulosa]|uniref:Ferric oxidoreductase domain-containing protein n=1 Tax=Paraphaeosphaeria sporulosa TaxID=1460663 RepID=A0A177CEH5_9PLEO|nr:uncharacterized protein CC84DRAFT_1217309 [Paraphaeosphaeria sporulosa]OAG06034.1 hypothetical protein CC84DRAFT_1217309 [Paraphaeosphaeria sporulosa]